MLTEEEQSETLNNLALRFREAKERQAQEKATVDALKKEIVAMMVDAKQENLYKTDEFEISHGEHEKKQMISKEDFIRRHSPQVYDSEGNPRVNDDGVPIVDLEKGKEFYSEHLKIISYRRFDVKRRNDLI